MKKILLFTITLFSFSLSQNKAYVDSLMQEILNANDEKKIEQYLQLSYYYQEFSPKEEITTLREGLKLAKQYNSDLLVNFYLNIASSFYTQTIYDSAMFYNNLAKKIYIENKDTLGLCNTLLIIGNYYSVTNNVDKALKQFNDIKKIALRKNLESVLASTYVNIGQIQFAKSQYNKALENFLLALNIDKKSGDPYRLVNSYINLGSLFTATNNYEKSTEYFYKAIHLAEKEHDLYHLWSIHNNLGILYEQKKDWHNSKIHIKETIKIAQTTHSNIDLAYSLLSLIKIRLDLGEYQNIDSLFNEFHEVAKNLNSKDLTSYFFDLRCRYAMEKDEFQEALKYHNLSVTQMYKILYPPRIRISHSIRLGKILSKLGKKEEGKKIVVKAILESDSLGLLDIKIKAYENLFKIFEEEEDYKNAFQYLKLYADYTDTLTRLQRKSNIEELEIIHNIDEQKHEHELIKKEKEIVDSKLKIQHTIISAFIFLSILAIIFVTIIMKSLIHKRRNNAVLKKQNKIIQNQKNELEKIIASKDRLYAIIGHDLYNAHSNISSFINVLTRSLDNLSKAFVEKLTKELRIINNNSLNLLDTLMEWGRIQTKKNNFRPVRFNLKALVNTNIMLFKKNIEEKSINVINAIPSDMEIFADKNMLGTIIRNLLSNGIKFTSDHGKITFSAKTDNNHIILSITDNGIGIKPDVLPKIFKIEETITTKGTCGEKGHGLGLIICKELVELHQGKIAINSDLDTGTTITLTLPSQ